MQLQSDLHRPPATIHGQLRRGQATRLAASGVALWLLFALLIRFSISAGLFGSAAASVLLFIAAIPLAWPMIWLCRHTAGLTPEQVVPGVAVASAAALLCDGVALTWAPSLYGPDAASILPVVAWLLWGVGVILTLSLVIAGREAA